MKQLIKALVDAESFCVWEQHWELLVESNLGSFSNHFGERSIPETPPTMLLRGNIISTNGSKSITQFKRDVLPQAQMNAHSDSLLVERAIEVHLSTKKSLPTGYPRMPRGAFARHSDASTLKNYYECTVPGCHKSFTRRAENAKAHWLSHVHLSPFECMHCERKFRRRIDLNRHLYNVHSK